MKKILWGVAAVVLGMFGLGGVLFSARQGGAFDVVVGALLLLGALACARRVFAHPRPEPSGQSSHSHKFWE